MDQMCGEIAGRTGGWPAKRMDGWPEGLEGMTGGQVDGRMDGRTDSRMGGRIGGLASVHKESISNP